MKERICKRTQFRGKFFILMGIFFLSTIFITPGYTQGLVINEIMAANSRTILDEDGTSADWIELYNAGASTINLEGYGLTDKPGNPLKWTLPALNLAPQQILLIFASGKDRGRNLNWQTVINWGDTWRYQVMTATPSSNWKTTTYNDTEWDEGASGFGYGDDDDATLVNQVTSVFIRKSFTLNDPNDVEKLVLHIDYDDSFVAYLNNTEIARANIGSPGMIIPFDQFADDNHEALIYQGNQPEKFYIDHPETILKTGRNVLAIQVHNVSATSSDMTAIPFLTLGFKNSQAMYTQGVAELIADDFHNVLHTNFKINADKETIVLSNPAGDSLDGFAVENMPSDVSYGRHPDGAGDWYVFSEPTPGSPNNTPAAQNFADAPVFSLAGGYYNHSFSVKLSKDFAPGNIYYTTDGSEPSETSSGYTGPISVNQTTVLRARTIAPDYIPSPIVTHSYILNEDFTLPVISLVTDPDNLWDYNTGIYVEGPNAEPNNPHYGANYWQDWEKPVHVEFFDTDGILAFSLDAGVKIFGGWSRAHAQKSLSIFARAEYGTKDIDYQIFPSKPVNQFKSFILRNSGNDWPSTLFRDALMQGLVKNCNLETMAYRPAIIYLNGEYWGIQNIREKLNEDFLAANCDIDPDNVDILENNGAVVEGDAGHYQNMLNYIGQHNMQLSATYDSVQSMMDVNNFIDYQIAEIYFDNTDWPGNNLKYWRPRVPGGKWRWLIYDTDFGFNLYGSRNYTNNTLAFALEPNGPGWPNPPWATLLFRKLVENPQFKMDFINRFADFLNTIFRPDRVADTIAEFEDGIAAEIPRHNQRWNGRLSNWLGNIEQLYSFAGNRPEYVYRHIQWQFNLPGTKELNLVVQPANSGKIKINSQIYANSPAYPVYFSGNPVLATAIPNKGYRFKGWNNTILPSQAHVEFDPGEISNLVAQFEAVSGNALPVVINEINYNSASTRDAGDWIELCNNSDDPVDLSDWLLSDSEDEHQYQIPANTVILGKHFLVLCRDKIKFNSQFPKIKNVVGNFEFGLDGDGELVRLFDNSGAFTDSVRFDNATPWPVAADGTGATLELKDGLLDNTLACNWQASFILGGTPGRPNSNITGLRNPDQKFTTFQLFQNYPNPFNDRTIIRYQLPEAAQVNIQLFNIQGQLIAQFEDGFRPAGKHQIVWAENARKDQIQNLPSGVYFYQMIIKTRTNNFCSTRKMLYLK